MRERGKQEASEVDIPGHFVEFDLQKPFSCVRSKCCKRSVKEEGRSKLQKPMKSGPKSGSFFRM